MPAQQRTDSGVPCSPVGQAGAREAGSSAAREAPTEAAENAGVPPKSPLAARSPGACLSNKEHLIQTLSTPTALDEHVMMLVQDASCICLQSIDGSHVCCIKHKRRFAAGLGIQDGKQAATKAPPHSFLPHLQPGRASPAARRGEVLAGPLTRASTPQPRSQVRCHCAIM